MVKKLVAAAIVIVGLIWLADSYFHRHPIAVLDPKGTIASQERHLIITAMLLMLIVVVPVFVLTFFIAWRYRAGNTKAKHSPNWDHDRRLETLWWGIPSAIILVLAVIAWQSSHQLDPFRSLAYKAQPLSIQVVALQWKWLFIYPEQHVASVNLLEIPEQTPINFQVTADAPMNSFWIPQLSGQIYAMPGMSTQLHILANSTGNYYGSSANISGDGFAAMNFSVHSVTTAGFSGWVNDAKRSPDQLNSDSYASLAQPGTTNYHQTYNLTDSNLYNDIVLKYMAPLTQGANP